MIKVNIHLIKHVSFINFRENMKESNKQMIISDIKFAPLFINVHNVRARAKHNFLFEDVSHIARIIGSNVFLFTGTCLLSAVKNSLQNSANSALWMYFGSILRILRLLTLEKSFK